MPVTLKMRLGWDDALAQRARAGAARRSRPACGWSPCMAARAASSTKGAPTGRRCAPSRTPCRSRVVVNGDIQSFDDADAALAASGADAVMVGRGAQGRPWFPGQLAHYLATGEREAAPALERATRADQRALRRNARPSRHRDRPAPRAQASRLGARYRGGDRRCACASAQGPSQPRAHRRRPAIVLRRLAEAFDAFANRVRRGATRHEHRREPARRRRRPMRCSMRCRIPSSSCRRTAR